MRVGMVWYVTNMCARSRVANDEIGVSGLEGKR